MILAAERVGFVIQGQRSVPIDVRSRRVKALILDALWATGDLKFRVLADPPEDAVSNIPIVRDDGTEVKITGATASTCYVVDPDDLEGISWLMFTSTVDQGTPAGFAVIPNTEDFSSGDPVTFTVSVVDPVEGTTSYDVVLDADYTDVAGLATELGTQASGITWSDNTGTLTAEYAGNFGSYVDVTSIVDPDDKMNFSSISGFAFPGYDEASYVTIITEPRT